VRVARDLKVARHRLGDATDLRREPVDEPVAERADPVDHRLALVVRERHRGCDRHDARDVLRAASPSSLLAASEDQRLELDALANGEHADALRAAELVPADRDQVRPRASATSNPRTPESSVCSTAAGAFSATFGDLGDRLDHADLVVDGHHRRPTRRLKSGTVESSAGAVDAPRCDRVLDRMEHRVVLDRRAHRDATSGGTPSTEVVGLGAVAGEDDLARIDPQQRGDQLARLVDRLAGLARSTVRSRRVAEVLGEVRQHRLDRLGSHRRARRVIEVGQLRHPERVGADPQRGGAKPPSSAGGSGVPPSGTSTGTGATPGGGNGDCDVGGLATVDQLRC
jgi:hypothetical protein